MATTTDTPQTPATRRAFEATVLPHTEAMAARALQLTKNPAEADNLVQEALIRALKFFHSYDPSQPPRAWLFTIVRNTFVNRWHAMSRRRDVHTAVRGEAMCVGAPTADDALEADETAVRVREAVDALPPQFRDAIRAVDLEGASYLEAAAALGVPKGTIMSRLSRGRKRLASLLTEAA